MSSTALPIPVHRGAMTIFAAASLVTIFAGSSAPTPLYRVYQQMWGLQPVVLTVIFAVYAFSLLASLLTVGSLSDYVGRRPVIFVALLVSALTMGLFATANSAWALIAARVVQGIATGAAMGTLGAAILDADRRHGPLVNSIMPLLGMSTGALGSSILVAFAPAPTHLVYVILLFVFLVEAAVVWTMPETTRRRPGAIASLRPHVAVPPHVRQAMLLITPGNVAAWALGGFYLSLMPSLLRVATGATSPLVGGIVVATLTLSGAGAIVMFRDWPPRRILPIGTSALAVGVAVTLFGVSAHRVEWLVVGTIIAGFGLGAGFFGASRTILPLAGPDERAGLLSAFYAQSYLAFSIPAIIVGLMAHSLGLTRSTYVYGTAIILLAVISFAASVTSLRRVRSLG
ncbi:MFS transporter [Acidisoma cladoniae]|uniref:MFS transporter n=1 Tax=Acidisoma cladoniae TaxID=3040935 RepID=UPI00254F17F7|nr:MFS transporter [Acidisoma sp. PAMC 29798]